MTHTMSLHRHRFALAGFLLLAALAAPNLTPRTASAQAPSPATTAPPTPDASQTPGASASPTPRGGNEQEAAAELCERATKPSVVDFMGGTPIEVVERTAEGTMLYGCEVIFSNSTSIIVGMHDASGWEEKIASLDYEPVDSDGTLHYSDILGLVWRPSGLDTYLSLRVPLLGLEHHYRVLSLLFEDG